LFLCWEKKLRKRVGEVKGNSSKGEGGFNVLDQLGQENPGQRKVEKKKNVLKKGN